MEHQTVVSGRIETPETALSVTWSSKTPPPASHNVKVEMLDPACGLNNEGHRPKSAAPNRMPHSTKFDKRPKADRLGLRMLAIAVVGFILNGLTNYPETALIFTKNVARTKVRQGGVGEGLIYDFA